MPSEKILDRIENLLRLAAPDSGATQPERENASVRAVELIIKNGITLRETVPEPDRRQAIRNAWVLTVAPYHCGCESCGKIISPRDTVWVKVLPSNNYVWRHNYGTCAVN